MIQKHSAPIIAESMFFKTIPDQCYLLTDDASTTIKPICIKNTIAAEVRIQELDAPVSTYDMRVVNYSGVSYPDILAVRLTIIYEIKYD